MKSDIKYILLLLTFLSLTNVNSLAQTESSIAKNTVFVEGLGNGGLGSINYDRIILLNNRKFSFRLGLMCLPIPIISINSNLKFPYPYSIPVEFNFLKGKKNHLEFGLGFTYVYGFNSKDYHVPDGSNFSTIREYSEAIYLIAKPIGYRFQKPSGGLFFRAGLGITAKIVELNTTYRNVTSASKEQTIGLIPSFSIGYTFRSKKS